MSWDTLLEPDTFRLDAVKRKDKLQKNEMKPNRVSLDLLRSSIKFPVFRVQDNVFRLWFNLLFFGINFYLTRRIKFE